MRKLVLSALMALFPVHPSGAEPADCRTRRCDAEYRLSSDSDLRAYGILIAAPDNGCRRVRFRVETETSRFLGHTPALGPGELAVVRLGRGFSRGEHLLSITPEGCAGLPSATRRVILAKTSPDHGWRVTQ